MAHDSANDVAGIDASDAPDHEHEHARRHARQTDSIPQEYDRRQHRGYVEAALQRAGHRVVATEPPGIHRLRRGYDTLLGNQTSTEAGARQPGQAD